MSSPHPALALAAARHARRTGERWQPVASAVDAAIAADVELAAAARAARRDLVRAVVARIGELDPRHAGALLDVPRERFVLPLDIERSADDTPLGLDPDGFATVSAPHAYLLTFGLLGLGEGDHLLELGTGTGYGAALAWAIVGPRGRVTTIEVDPVLAERARRLLAPASGVTVVTGDARLVAATLLAGDPRPNKVAVTYALSRPSPELERALGEGAVLVAPVGAAELQELTRWERRGGTLTRTVHGAVRYVPERNS